MMHIILFYTRKICLYIPSSYLCSIADCVKYLRIANEIGYPTNFQLRKEVNY